MRGISLVGVALFGVGLLTLWMVPAGAQRRFYDSPRGLYTQQLVRRIDELERRVARLERLLPRNGWEAKPLDVATAEQRLAAAEHRLAYATELHRKGYISSVQLEAEQFELKRARKVLRFAEAARDGQSTVQAALEIQLLDAKRDLQVAEGQLRVAERMLTQGFADRSAVDAYRLAVDVAQKRLDEVRAKADQP